MCQNTSAPKMQAGSRGRHLGEFARPECERPRTNATSAPRMRAGSHRRNLKEVKRSECERARTDAISREKGHRRRRPECERARTNATSATSRALSSKRMCHNTSVLSTKIYDNKSPARFGRYRFVDAKQPLFKRMSVLSRGNGGATVQGAQQ